MDRFQEHSNKNINSQGIEVGLQDRGSTCYSFVLTEFVHYICALYLIPYIHTENSLQQKLNLPLLLLLLLLLEIASYSSV